MLIEKLLYNNKIGHCIILDCSKFKLTLSEEIKNNVWDEVNALHNNKYVFYTLSILFNGNKNRSIVVFDNFDNIIDNYNTLEINKMLSCMSHDSLRNNNYIVQLNINDRKKYNNLYLLR